jgi:hypothetical protein
MVLEGVQTGDSSLVVEVMIAGGTNTENGTEDRRGSRSLVEQVEYS